MAKVPYNMDTCMKCMCPSCPVQSMSECIMEKRADWQKMRIEMAGMEMPMGGGKEEMGMMGGEMEGMEMLPPEKMIGVYCSAEIGKSKCSDLDNNKMCTCPACKVWEEYDLKSQYYCTEGDADQRG